MFGFTVGETIALACVGLIGWVVVATLLGMAVGRLLRRASEASERVNG